MTGGASSTGQEHAISAVTVSANRRGLNGGVEGEQRSRPRRGRPLVSFGHWWWALPGMALVILIHYIAVASGGFFAFTDWSGIGSFEVIGWDNFARIIADPIMVGSISNTLFLAIGSVVLTNAFGLGLALALNRGLKTRYLLRTIFFMPVVLSQLATAYIWRFIFDYGGPINELLVAIGLPELRRVWLADPSLSIWVILIVMTWQMTGFVMVIYLAGLATVPQEIEEAAAIDGAGVFGRFWHITLPSIRPAIAIATTLGIIQGLRVFDQIIALTGGGPARATETLATMVYREAFALGNFGFGAALALILTLIILVFAIFQQYITRDRSAGKER